MIALARRVRKPLGGGMRQAGIIAAGALYALDHHVDRLAEDHANAQTIADAVRQCDSLELEPARVDTNIVIFRVDPKLGTAGEFCQRLEKRGVHVYPFGKAVRAVTHLGVSADECRVAAEQVKQAAGG